jgi:hypothetical protein
MRFTISDLKDINQLTWTLRQVYRFLYDKNMLNNHTLTSTFFIEAGQAVAILAITKITVDDYQPNIPCIRGEMSDTFISVVQDAQVDCDDIFRKAMSYQVGRGTGLNIFIHEFNTRNFQVPSKELLINYYKSVYDGKEDVLKNNFEARHSNKHFGWYKVIISLLIAHLNEGEELYKKIFIDEYAYGQKLLGDKMNYTVLSGLPPMLAIEEGTEVGHNEKELMSLKKRIGTDSVNGQVLLLDLKNKYMNKAASAVVKLMTEKIDTEVEYENGKQLNDLRYSLPHYMYTFDHFFCSRDIIVKEGEKGADNVISLDLSKSDRACFKSYPTCDKNLEKTGPCSIQAGFIFLEYIRNPTPMKDFVKKVDPNISAEVMELMSIVMQLALALKIAQENVGFVHNDLHLDNALLIANPSLNGEPMILTSYTLFDGRVYEVPVFGMIPVMIDFGTGRTDVTTNLVIKSVKGQKEQYFKDLVKFSDCSDILMIIKHVSRYLKRKGPSDIGKWFEEMDVGKTFKGAPLHVDKSMDGLMDDILEDINEKMLEIVPLKERKNATLRYKWGRVPDPGYQG